jgi:hypothetical protein
MIDFHFRHDIFAEQEVTCTLTQNVLDSKYQPIVEDDRIIRTTTKLL